MRKLTVLLLYRGGVGVCQAAEGVRELARICRVLNAVIYLDFSPTTNESLCEGGGVLVGELSASAQSSRSSLDVAAASHIRARIALHAGNAPTLDTRSTRLHDSRDTSRRTLALPVGLGSSESRQR